MDKSTKEGLSEDEYLDIVERIQQAAMIEPFRPPVADVVALVGQYRVYERLLRHQAEQLDEALKEIERLRTRNKTLEDRLDQILVLANLE